MTEELKIKLNDGIVISFPLPSLEMEQNEFLGLFERIHGMIKRTQKFSAMDKTYEQLKTTSKRRHRTDAERRQFIKTHDNIKNGKSTMTMQEFANSENLTLVGVSTNYANFKKKFNGGNNESITNNKQK